MLTDMDMHKNQMKWVVSLTQSSQPSEQSTSHHQTTHHEMTHISPPQPCILNAQQDWESAPRQQDPLAWPDTLHDSGLSTYTCIYTTNNRARASTVKNRGT